MRGQTHPPFARRAFTWVARRSLPVQRRVRECRRTRTCCRLAGGDATPGINKFLATQPSVLLYDARASAPVRRFTWNRQLTKPELGKGTAGTYARDPIYVTLTVTDTAGATDSVTQLLDRSEERRVGKECRL